MKRLWVVLFFCVGALLAAQERSEPALYVVPATGGSPEEQAFFGSNIAREIESAGYRVTDSREAADFLVSITIVKNDDPAHSSTLLLDLRAASGGDSPTLELSWSYREMEELHTWNIRAILSSQISGDSEALDIRWQRTHRLYAGLRGGVSLAGRYFQSSPGYSPSYGAGTGAEGGLLVELRLFRFLALQAEGNFVYEVFDAPGTVVEGEDPSADTYTAMSLMFPLVAKVPLSFGRLTLSLYAGAYYILTLGKAEKESGVSGETEQAALTMTFPLGVTVGTEAGFALGRGELFADLRYGRDFGATVIGEGDGFRHVRDRISVCLGYKFGLLDNR
jgi:hypothetical protein